MELDGATPARKVCELVVGDDMEPAEEGYSIYRSLRVRSLYGPEVMEEPAVR